MAKFQWRLQRLLEYRQLLEKQAKDAFLQAKARTNGAEADKARMERDLASQIPERSSEDLHLILSHGSFVERLEDLIQSQAAVISVLVDEEETFRLAWIFAKQESEALLKLRERALAEWQIEETRLEQNALDEWAVMRRTP
ncbi:MAG: flagellar FliJ family protein [Fimbriimonadaceae bacterium]|jgi:flagellar FliJ protein|nr:flagellar FliJ family protein [Fimbriimonadaceae bacterium]